MNWKVKKYVLLFITFTSLYSSGYEITGTLESLVGYGNKNQETTLSNTYSMLPNYIFNSYLRLKLYQGENFVSEFLYNQNFAQNTNSFYVRQLFVYLNFLDFVYLKIGRQFLGFGTGYFWSAINDLDERKDAIFIDRYISGVDAIKVGVDFRNFFIPISFNFEVLPPLFETNYIDLSFSKLALQTSGFFDPVQVGIVSSYRKLVNSNENILFGGYVSVDVFGSILSSEISFSKKKNVFFLSNNVPFAKDEYYVQFLINFNKSVSEKSFVVLEYFYNNFGLDEEETQKVFSGISNNIFILPYLYDRFTPGYFSKNYIFFSFSSELVESLSFSISGLVNIDRVGGLFSSTLTYNGIENLDLSLSFHIFTYELSKKSEISEQPFKNFLLLNILYYY